MYIFVPSTKVTKSVFGTPIQRVLDEVDQRIGDVLDEQCSDPQCPLEIEISQPELDLLIKAIETDIRQCGTDDSESSLINYRIHFNVKREKVESLLAKLLVYRTNSN